MLFLFFFVLILATHLLYQFKLKRFAKFMDSLEPSQPLSGDIIIYFDETNDIWSDPSNYLLYKCVLTLPTYIPYAHVGVVGRDGWVVESKLRKTLDYKTGKHKRGFRYGKLKELYKDWPYGRAIVLHTHVYDSPDVNTDISYLNGMGCIGFLNWYMKKINPKHKNCYYPEGLFEQYGNNIGLLQ